MGSFLHVMPNNSFSSISEMDWIVVAIAFYLGIWFSVVRPLVPFALFPFGLFQASICLVFIYLLLLLFLFIVSIYLVFWHWIAFFLLFSELFRPNGKWIKMGDLIKRTKYAKTLEKIAQHGADLFYTGKMAKQVRIYDNTSFFPSYSL